MFVRRVRLLILLHMSLFLQEEVHSLRSLVHHDAARMASSRIRCFCEKTLFHAVVSIAPLIVTPFMTLPAHAALPPSPVVYSWHFENGSVTISDPLPFGDKLLRQPRLLGSGGGGAVFALTQDEDRRYAVKTSWASSTESVVNECRVLQYLEETHVTGIERCLATQSYRDVNGDTSDDHRRVMILLEPVMEGPIAASLSELSPQLQRHAIGMILQSMLQILSANVAVTDVQMLISQKTGDVLFIDFSEARAISPSSTGTMSFMEQALLSNFIQEVSAMIPDDQIDFAADIVSQWLKRQKSEGVYLNEHTLALLEGQFLVNKT